MDKTLTTPAITTGLLVTCSLGCKDDSGYFSKNRIISGYNVQIGVSPAGRNICIEDPDVANGYILGKDLDNDGRIDQLFLRGLPKGHHLENYANLDSLEATYNSILEGDNISIEKNPKNKN